MSNDDLLKTLLAKLRALQAQTYELAEEMDRVLGGSAWSLETPPQADGDTRSVKSATRPGLTRTQEQADFETFRLAYPASRRIGGKVGYRAFCHAKFDSLAQLLLALEQHKRSEQWQTPKLIPLMTTWLHQERWNQTLPEATLPARNRIGAGRFAPVPDGEPL